MCSSIVRRFAFLATSILFAPLVVGQTLAISLEGVTPTQAVFSYDTADTTACSVRVTESANPSILVHDVDPALFSGADRDLSRPTAFTSGTRRYITIGARTSALGKDAKLYSRALQAATAHLLIVACASSTGTVPFTTQNPPLGSTYPDVPPFNPAGFGNYAWPTVDWTDPAKTYVDPMTGLLLKPAHAVNPQGQAGEWGNQPYEFPFADAFDLNLAWTGTSKLFSASTAGPFATYSGKNSDPIFLPFPKFTQNPQGSIGGWTTETAIWDDARLTLYGYGGDANPENRKMLVCLAAFYVPAANQCTGKEIELTLPGGTAGTVATPNFPGLGFPGWAIGRFLTKEESATTTGTVTVANSVAKWVDGYYFPVSMAVGVKIKIGAAWYTVASVDSATQLTLAEPGVMVTANTPYQLGAFGIRIRKKTGVGTVNLNASWALAWTRDPVLPINGSTDICNRLAVTVTYQADGVTPLSPAQQGNLCLVGNQAKVLMLLIPATGETRVLSGLQHQDAGSSTAPQVPLGAFSNTDPLTLYGLHGDDVVANPALRALYRITYNAGLCHFKAWVGNNYGFSLPAPTDCMTWINVTPNSAGRGVFAQFQGKVTNNLFWNSAVMSATSLGFAGISGSSAVFTQYFGGPQNSPCFIALFDANTGTLTEVVDTFGGSPGMRFAGCHTVPYISLGNWVAFGLTPISAKNGPGYLGGPFKIKSIDALSKNGGATWSTDTSLTNLDAGTCTTVDAAMIAKGATAARCIKVRVSSDYPCNQTPANGDAAKYPCPWNPSLAGPMPMIVGDYISDLWPWPLGEVGGKNEKLLITTKTDLGGGNWELELMRWAACDELPYFGHLNGGEDTNRHASGWLGYMSGTGMCGGSAVWLNATDPAATFFVDNLFQGHGAVGPAPNAMYASVEDGGSSRIGPIPGQFSMLPTYMLNLNTTMFAGVLRNSDGSDVESYPNLGQWTASDVEKSYAFDLRHYNPFYGVGPERPAGIWSQTYALVPGATQLYKIDNRGGVFGKVFPYLAFAGRYLLQDMSGPSSSIGDADVWKFCVAYKPGECRPAALVNDVYVNVPHATMTNSCTVNTYALNVPCFTTPFNYSAWAIQFQITRDDLIGTHYRQLTMGFTGPGRQYQFTSIHVTPDGHWAFLAPGWVDGVRSEPMLVKIPPAPIDDGIDRTTFLDQRVTLPANTASAKARARFGYAENGPIGSFFCTSRQEACLTDSIAKPFAYELSDSLSPTSCSSGCVLSIPRLPGRVLYYRVEHLDDSGKIVSVESLNVAASNAGSLIALGPTASITSPAPGSTISGSSVKIIASASAGTGQTIASVQFKRDTVNEGNPAAISPYTLVLDSTKLKNGSYSFTVAATDSLGNTTTSGAVLLSVNNAITTVVLTAPAADATLAGASVFLSATATPAPGLTIASVQFKVDGFNQSNSLTTPPYNTILDTTQLADGPHAITAAALDSSGITTLSAALNVIVSNNKSLGTPLLSGFTPTYCRNDSTASLGMQFTVGPLPLTVTALGRVYIAGNLGRHLVRLVRVNDGTDVPSGSVTVALPQGAAGQFAFTQLAIPAQLAANTSYYLLSSETAGGDCWYGFGPVTPTNVAIVNGPVYWSGSAYAQLGIFNGSYVPVNLMYTVSSAQPPTITIGTPADGATISGKSVLVSAIPSAAGGLSIASVQFKVDNLNEGAPLTTSPYSVVLDSTKLPDGAHSITALATDSTNNSGISAPVRVTVNNSVIAITTPTDGAPVSGSVSVAAGVTPGVGVTIVSVQFKVDNITQGAAVTVRPYSITLDSARLTDGSYTLTAEAVDSAGNTNISAPVKITVTNQVLSVSILAPKAGAVVVGSILLSAAATAGGGSTVKNVQFKVDNASFGPAVTSSPFNVTLDSTKLTSGAHSVGAVATDSSGNTVSAPPMNITVSNVLTSVAITSPSAGPVTGANVPVSAAATPATGLTVVSVQFKLDNSNLGPAVTSSPYSVTLDSTKLTSGAHSIGAVATDSSGNTVSAAPVSITVSNVLTSVMITSPIAGPVTGANVSVSAAATPATGLTIVSVQFKLDNSNLGPAVTTIPYNVTLDSTTLTSGAHSIGAVATDSSGTSVSAAPVSITVSNVLTSVMITSPSAGPVTGANVPVSAAATPATGLTIVSVQFKLDNSNLGPAVTSSPYSVTFDSTKLTSGAHSIGAVATDSNGNSVSAAPVSITVSNVLTSLMITSPIAGPVTGANVAVSAAATPGTGLTIASVQFKLDNSNLGPALTNSPYGFTLDSTKLTSGAHSIGAVATDSSGNTVSAAPVSITVSNVLTSVMITSPIAGPVTGANVPVSAAATPGTGLTIVSVQFKLDNSNLGPALTSIPYSVTLDSTKLTSGTHSVGAVATDSSGTTVSAAPVSITVSNVLTSVMITSPGAGPVTGANVPVSAAATPGTGLTIASVQFKLDNSNLGPALTNSPYSVTLDSTKLSSGAHSIGAVATDSSGTTVSAAPVSITVSNVLTSVMITSPGAGPVTGTNVPVSAAATPGTGLAIASVQFKLDNSNLGPAVTNSPYSFTLDSTKLTSGAHSIGAVATDSNGNTVSAALVSITVTNVLTSVMITSPIAGPVTGANVPVSAAATPGTGLTIASVQFKLDNSNLGPALTNSPYSFTLDSTKLTSGAHSIGAVATDSSGTTVSAAPVSITVTNVFTSVMITSPSAGATVTGSSVPVSAAATPATGLTIVSVQFTLDNSNLSTPITSSPYSLTLDTTKLINGTHSIGAVATDSSNKTTSAAAVTFIVNNVKTTSAAFITSFGPGSLRGGYTGWLGMQFTVGPAPLSVTALGRLAIPGNTGTHTLKLVRAADASDVPGASGAVSLVSAPAGQFAYASLANAVTLEANTSYYLLSMESSSGDQWYDFLRVTPASAGSVNGPVYFRETFVQVGIANGSYGPLNLLFGPAQ